MSGTPTPLTEIHLPERALADLAAVGVDEWITNHRLPVSQQWWTDELTGAGLQDTVLGDHISRGQIFELATKAATDPDGALTLLWNSLAWGSGNKLRNNSKRIASVAADPQRARDILTRAATLSRQSPIEAYAVLYPGDRKGAIPQLGPAFFTKYLYFAGGGHPDHPCAIIDENVARALHDRCGWNSLPIKGGWSAAAYDRYCTLLGMWVNEHAGIDRRDVIERWLFEEGKRLAPPKKAPNRRKRT